MPPEFTETALESFPTGTVVVDDRGGTVASNRAWWTFLDEAGVDPSVLCSATNYLGTLRAADGDLEGSASTADLAVTLTLPYHASDDGDSHRLRVAPTVHDDEWYAVVSVADGTVEGGRTQLKERAMDEAPAGIIISDYTVPDNPLVYANAAFQRITGYEVTDILGRNCRFLQCAGTDEEAVDRFRDALAENESVTVELLNERADGERFWNAVTIAPLRNASGAVTNWVGFQQDVTDRKRAEEALSTERDQYALLNQIVRHDIRNDMAVIEGWGTQIDDVIPPERREALERIMAAATHTRELTDAVRDLAGILGTDDPALEPIDLGAVLRTEIDRVRSTFEYRADSLTIRGEESLPSGVEVLATPLLSSVFTNVLDNAVFHSDTDDVRIDVSVEVDAETVRVNIADNGPGVPDAQKRAVFDQGEQGIESSGSGLGLYLVDQLVERFGGTVRIGDNEPRGAVVRIDLRRA